MAYKRSDYAIRWFVGSGRKVRIAGDGPEFKRLKKLAGSSVEFAGEYGIPNCASCTLVAGRW